MANAILQPARSFRFTVDFTFPPDARSDAELVAFILTSVSASLALGPFGVGASCARIPLVEKDKQQ
jgi:hypothetical protein